MTDALPSCAVPLPPHSPDGRTRLVTGGPAGTIGATRPSRLRRACRLSRGLRLSFSNAPVTNAAFTTKRLLPLPFAIVARRSRASSARR